MENKDAFNPFGLSHVEKNVLFEFYGILSQLLRIRKNNTFLIKMQVGSMTVVPCVINIAVNPKKSRSKGLLITNKSNKKIIIW